MKEKGNWIVGTLTAAMLTIAAYPSFAQDKKADAKKADPALQACTSKLGTLAATNKQIAAEVEKGRKARNISAEEDKEIKNMSAAFNAEWGKAKEGGVTAAKCEATLKSKNDLLAKVRAMAASPAAKADANKANAKKADAKKADPAVTACIGKLNATSKEINAEMAKGRKAGNISVGEANENKKMTDATMADWKKKQQGGVTVQECEATHKSLTDQLAKVKAMAATPAKKKPDAKKADAKKADPKKADAKKADAKK